MAAASLERIGDSYLAPGYSTEFMAVFLLLFAALVQIRPARSKSYSRGSKPGMP